MEEFGMKEPALNRLIQSAYKLLNLDTYFTAGVQEVRAWTIHRRMESSTSCKCYSYRF